MGMLVLYTYMYRGWYQQNPIILGIGWLASRYRSTPSPFTAATRLGLMMSVSSAAGQTLTTLLSDTDHAAGQTLTTFSQP